MKTCVCSESSGSPGLAANSVVRGVLRMRHGGELNPEHQPHAGSTQLRREGDQGLVGLCLPTWEGVPPSDQRVRCEGSGLHSLGADGQNRPRCPDTWNSRKRPLARAGEKNQPEARDRADVQAGIVEWKASLVPPFRAASARGPLVTSWQPRMPPGCRHVSGSVISLTITTLVSQRPLGSGEKKSLPLRLVGRMK